MKIVKYSEDLIEFDNGYTIEAEHYQDCCEHVYADCEVLKNYNILPHTGESISITDIEFDTNIEKYIELIEGEGFNLVAIDGSKWFIPCYNEQNGYYSSDLTLVIQKDGIKISLDISQCVEDCID